MGKKLKLSRERVKQLEERAIRRLKSIAMRIKLIDAEDAKKIMLDSRQDINDRRQIERRVAKRERRQGYPDKRRVKLERRKAKRERRRSKYRPKTERQEKGLIYGRLECPMILSI